MQRSTSRDLFELLSSMRFAISLLTVLAIASIIGTVVEQNQAFNNYLNQFGPFWFPVFEKLGLYSVYNATWFLVILAFLVLSTSLCIVRQTAPMLREIRSFREHAREVSLRRFAHQATLATPLPRARAQAAVVEYLRASGFGTRLNERAGGVLVAARQGSAGRSGYFLAHGAIVLICIGGLLDGDLPLRIQLATTGKQPTTANQLIAEIPDSARLSADNWSFRGNLFIPEGRSNRYAVLQLGDGILLQALPFAVALERFHVEHYENGMPSRFASDLIVTDLDTGESFTHVLEVNKPLEHRGITIYQSGFEDGGSRLEIDVRSLVAGTEADTRRLEGAIGDILPLAHAGEAFALELTDFQVFNVEDMNRAEAAAAEAPSAGLRDRLGSGATIAGGRDFRNVGPSFQFRLRDETGQAREFHNYMLPMERQGAWFMFSGMRESVTEDFRYIRFPLDEDGGLDTWFAIHARLLDPARHASLADRLARRNLGTDTDPEALERFTRTAERTVALFSDRGFLSIGRFVEETVPAAEHERATDLFIGILQGLAWEAWMLSREEAGLGELALDTGRMVFLHNTLSALSDSRFYESPVYLQLAGYDHVQATVLQLTRSPGKNIVYLGSLLLVLGIFAMLYIRERRLFILIKDDGEALVAMSSNRKTLDIDESFERHVDGLREVLASETVDRHTEPA